MRRQEGVLVLLTLSHPQGLWEGIQSWLAGRRRSTAGLVIIQSHVSQSVSGSERSSPAGLHRTEAERGRENKTFVCHVFMWNPVRRVCTDASCLHDMRS